jgi:hypothetical protein
VVRDYPLAVPSSDIGDHLGQLLDGADGSDVSFIVDGKKFAAHRAVLAARSPVFKAELFGAMAEAKMSSHWKTLSLLSSRFSSGSCTPMCYLQMTSLGAPLWICIRICLPQPTGTPWID